MWKYENQDNFFCLCTERKRGWMECNQEHYLTPYFDTISTILLLIHILFFIITTSADFYHMYVWISTRYKLSMPRDGWWYGKLCAYRINEETSESRFFNIMGGGGGVVKV